MNLEALLRLEDPADLKRGHELVSLMRSGEGLADFIRRTQPHRPPPPHIMPLIRRIEAAREKPLRLVVTMPPRHVKTTTLVNAFSWWLSLFPGDTCGYYTYSDEKARSESRKARDLAIGVGIDISEDAANLKEWRTSQGGGLLAGGAGGGLTGYGISGIMAVDDPYKNREEADSRIIRDKIWEWFNEVAFTRDEGCSFIVTHTRWHDDDLAGKLVKQGWEELRLSALAEENDPLGRELNAALWPEMFSEERLAIIRKQIGEFSWASLYQQRPRPRGAKLFGPEHYYDPKTVDFTECRASIGADTAASKKTSADSSAAVAGMVRGRDKDTRITYITEAYKEQMTVPQFARDLRAFQARNHGAMAAVEGAGIGKGTYQAIKDVDPKARIFESETRGDKFQRAQGVAAAWNDGRVLVPLGNPPWLAKFLSDVQDFTGVNDAEDDIPDALAHMWNAIDKDQGEWSTGRRTAGTRR